MLERVEGYRRVGNTMIITFRDGVPEGACEELGNILGAKLNCYVDGNELQVFLKSSSGIRIQVVEHTPDQLADLIGRVLKWEPLDPTSKALYVRYVSLNPETVRSLTLKVLKAIENYETGRARKIPKQMFMVFEKVAKRVMVLDRLRRSMVRRKDPIMRLCARRIEEIIDLAYQAARKLHEYDIKHRMPVEEVEG